MSNHKLILLINNKKNPKKNINIELQRNIHMNEKSNEMKNGLFDATFAFVRTNALTTHHPHISP